MFINSAFAETTASVGAQPHSALSTIWLFAGLFAIMYFFIIRPQRNQEKKRLSMLSSIKRGDTIITAGGIIGKVIKVNNEKGEIEVEISKNVTVQILRATVSTVRVSSGDTEKQSSSEKNETNEKDLCKAKKEDV